jgi:hypothetical protein
MKALILAASALMLAPAALATDFNITYAPEFAEELEDNYGLREGDYLTKSIQSHLQRELSKAGVEVSRIDVRIEDARPNRPTFKQLGDRIGLSSRSISTGGMELTATAFNASGTEITTYNYDWFENRIQDAGPTTWYDAKKASRRFARKFAKELAGN